MYTVSALAHTTRSGYTRGVVANRIQELRKRRRISAARLGALLNSGRSTVVKLERGEMRLTQQWMDRIAAALGVDAADLLPGGGDNEVPVMGYVGEGAEIFPYDDTPVGEGLYRVLVPRGLDPKKTVAAEIRGDSMLPIEPGWVVFWTKMFEGVPIDALGHLCVVKLANDGPMLIKHLRRGYSRGRFNLLSNNAAIREDEQLEWASRIRAVLPRDLVLPAGEEAAPTAAA
jgi:transcriptional regulator with XRE-family HTH domain